MQVFTDINHLPSFSNAVLTIGTFDGVHKGHKQIIEQLKLEADHVHGTTVVVTFYPHPRQVVKQDVEVKFLNTFHEKVELLKMNGIENLVVVPFTEAFSNIEAEEYVQEFLVEKFKPYTIILGYNHRFGKGRKGDYLLLEALREKYNYRVTEIPEHVVNEVSVSSTKIREALLTGDVKTANDLLGYPYSFEGTVSKGKQLGRTIGYPTANVEVEDMEKLIPGNGVYAVTVSIEADTFNGMMNIGVRPTVDGSTRTIEINIFDFTDDIYGKMVRVFVHAHLRPENKFAGLDELKLQLSEDKKNAIELLSNI